jgi:hypothetical protein
LTANDDNTLLPKDHYWLRVSIPENQANLYLAFPQLIDIQAQALKATFVNQDNDPNHLGNPLPANTISKFVKSDSAVKKIFQPDDSFGGRMIEKSDRFYVRVSERLRHKQRAITIWDYERLVLEAFPSLYQVKCLNHTNDNTELMPGSVRLVVIPNVQGQTARDKFAPKVSNATLQTIRDFLTKTDSALCNPFIDLKVENPIYEAIRVNCQVAFYPDQDPLFAQKQYGWLSNRYNPDNHHDIPLPDQLKGKPTFYYQCNESDRSYEIKFQPDNGYKSKILNGLYDVLLQLEEDAEFGDLNSNVIPWVVENSLGQTKQVKAVLPPIEVQFPSWDYPIVQILDYDTLTLATVTNYHNINGEITFDLKLDLTNASQTLAISVEGIKLLIERKETVVINETEITSTFEAIESNSFAFRLFKQWQMIMERIKGVFCVLHQHRNLCEDYVKFRLVPTQEIAICADIEVTADSDLEEILAKIYSEIDLFLAPPVRFYSLKEMQGKGKSTEEIFQSMILDHGFIETEELVKSELKSEIHVSDLYQIIMEIEGVIAVKDLLITNYLDGVAQTDGELWCLKLGDLFNLNLYLEKSRVLFYKNNLPFRADIAQVKRLVKTLKATKQKPKLIRSEQDLPIPSGNYRDLSQYISIQTEFPLVYGIGAEGLSTTATESRKAQAKQLKAFLMFFDQLLANYLAQLDQVKNLLSINSNIEHTYAVQPLYKGVNESDQDDFPRVANLFSFMHKYLHLAHGQIKVGKT